MCVVGVVVGGVVWCMDDTAVCVVVVVNVDVGDDCRDVVGVDAVVG